MRRAKSGCSRSPPVILASLPAPFAVVRAHFETRARHREINQPPAHASQHPLDRGLAVGLDQEHHTAPAARAADLRRARTYPPSLLDHPIYSWRRDAFEIVLAVFPFEGQQFRHVVPVVCQEGLAHLAGDGRDLVEVAPDFFISVNM